MLKIAILGVAGVLLAIQFKGGKAEYSTYITMGVSLMIFAGILAQLEIFADTIQKIGALTGLDGSYIRTLLKMIGITYTAEVASGICKDAGYQSVAVQVEIFGKLLILSLSVPIILTVFQMIGEFLS